VSARRQVKELERRLRDEPDNLALRLKLAAALFEVGRTDEAIELYRSVAAAYQHQERVAQAIEVCRSLLALAPGDGPTVEMLEALESTRAREQIGIELPLQAPPSAIKTRPPGIRASRRETLRGVMPSEVDASVAPAWLPTPAADEDLEAESETSPRMELVADLPEGIDATDDFERSEATDEGETDPGETDPSDSLGVPAAVIEGSHPKPAPDAEEGTEPGARWEMPPAQRDLIEAFGRSSSQIFRRRARRPSFIERSLMLFPGMPEEAVDELVANVIHRSYEPGEIVLREGEPGDACFLLTAGSVRVLKRDPLEPRGDLLEVTRLGAGTLFGEFALLADRRRHATVAAVTRSRALEIPRRLIQRIVKSYPEMKPILERYFRERMVSNLLVTAPFLRVIEEGRRAELLAEFVPMRVEPGEAVVRQNQRSGGFYLIVLGGVEITKELPGDRNLLLATLGEGAYFGVLGLLRGDVARASVVATGPTELAMLPPQSFYDLIAELPVLWDEVRREANKRELEMYELVAGVTGAV
jgi:CRP-like cAMP-binding protein